MADEVALRSLIAAQDGVFTSAQARACGISPDIVRRRVQRGDWVRVAHGVYRVADHAVGARTRMRIAVHATGAHAALCGPAAAWWWRLVEQPRSPITVIAPHGRHGRAVDGVHVWHRTLDPRDVATVDGLPVTSLALTVLDASVDIGVRVMDSALLRGRVSLGQLLAVQRRNAGRRGSPRSRAMLAAMSEGARSEAERRAVALLRSARLSGWHTNFQACGYLLDIAFPAHKLDIEIDGVAFHSGGVAFQHDRDRQNVLTGNGWTVLRFTWHDITERPGWVIAQIRAALNQAERRIS